MTKNSGSVGVVAPQKIAFEQPLALQNGQVLPRFDLMVETYGKLNAAKSNAVLICHALSGNHHVAGKYAESDKHSGWWDNMVGPGKPIDTDRLYVLWLHSLCVFHISSGLMSLKPGTAQTYYEDFLMFPL